MFERFTDKARRAIVVAQDEARALENNFIQPEHLLLALLKTEGGLALTALSEAGVNYEAVRERVAQAHPPTPGAAHLNKVPFSPQAKKVLELGLREALQLGHNYIGTEHLLLGLLRGAARGAGTELSGVKEILGGLVGQLNARVLELVSSASPPGAVRSPAASGAIDRARQLAGKAPMTTGHLLTAVIADPDSQASKALSSLGVASGLLAAALAQVEVAGSSDELPGPGSLEVKVGDEMTTIQDPDLAAALRGLAAGQMRALLRQALGMGPAHKAAG